MKKIASLLLIFVMIMMVGCNRTSTNNDTVSSANNEAEETVAGSVTDISINNAENSPAKENTHYCFYVKNDALYFVSDKDAISPIKLTENLITSSWHDEDTVGSLAGTLSCIYDEGTDLAFYSDYGNSNLYYRNTAAPDSEAVHVADNIAWAYTRYIPEKAVVYYLANNLELYEYDITTGTAALVANQVSNVSEPNDADIVYQSDSGLYAKNAHEEPYPIDKGSSSSSDGSDGNTVFRDIISYDSGERYYLSLDSSANELVLCYWDGSSVSELYRHQKMNYHAETIKDSPKIALTFPSFSQTYNGDTVIAVRDNLSVVSNSSVDQHMKFNPGGTKFYYLEASGQNSFRLMGCDINSSGAGSPTVVAEDAGKMKEGFCWNDESGVYYIKTDANNWGYLYYNEAQADPERLFGVIGTWNQKLLYKTVSAEAPYTLKASDHGETIVINNNVHSVYRQDDALWLISNYSAGAKTGDLNLYINGESTLMDQNIIKIVS